MNERFQNMARIQEIQIVDETLKKFADAVVNGKTNKPVGDVIIAVYSTYDEKTVETFDYIKKDYNSLARFLKYLNKPGYNVTAYTKDGLKKLKLIANGSLQYLEKWTDC